MVTRHELRSGYGWLSPLLTQQTGRPFFKRRRLQEILASAPFDVVHYHNVSLLGSHALSLSTSGSHPIKMYTTHEHWLICPTHVLWKFNSRACEKPECLKCTLMARKPPQLWRYTGQLAEMAGHVDQFVSPSRFTADMHAQRGFPKAVAHLPYFLDRADDDWRHPQPRLQEKPYFLFVGRLERIKGLQTLIRLWTRIADYDLLVAGTGDFEPELRAMAAGNPQIKFLGARPQRELGALYVHAVAGIVPSITYETFGIIIIEAFARKTPVIARNLGALPEVINDSGGGFTYDTDEELLDAIERIGRSPELRADLGERGYGAFTRGWTREAHLDLYFDFLRNIAERRFERVPWESEEVLQEASKRTA
jgi:glycosyltransferase involved in cell wall biosynthesis